MSTYNIKVGDYVEGFEHTLPRPRYTRGWVTKINKDLGFVQAKVDDDFNGHRGTLYDLETITVLPYKEEI